MCCEKIFCKQIKIGKQGEVFLKCSPDNLLGWSLRDADPASAPPAAVLQRPLRPHGSAPSHITSPFPWPSMLDPSCCPPCTTPANTAALCMKLGAGSGPGFTQLWGWSIVQVRKNIFKLFWKSQLMPSWPVYTGRGPAMAFSCSIFLSAWAQVTPAHWYFSHFNKMQQALGTACFYIFSFGLNHPNN